MRKGQSILWAVVFVVIFLMSQDYLFMTWERGMGLLGLPNWVYWFGLVHLIFVSALALFAKYYWKE